MSVVGIGTDILEIARISDMQDTTREKLAKRVLTPTELTIYQHHPQKSRYLAKRWAVKEAAAKALKTGIAAGVSFQHFEVTNDERGAPYLVLSEKALDVAHSLNATSWHVSIADELRYATAFVVLSSDR